LLNIELIRNSLAAGKSFINEIYYSAEIDSTNAHARKSRADSMLVLTDFQTAGKGRFNRVWESERGSNLTFTIKRKLNIKPAETPYINFFFTYHVFCAIKAALETNNADTVMLRIKWPNDIIYNGKKISGILVETNLTRNEFIIGIGININQETFTRELGAVSMKNITGSSSDISDFLIKLIEEIGRSIHKLSSPVEKEIYLLWKKACDLIGKEVQFSGHGKSLKSARIIDLPEDGSIQLLINGEKKGFYSGEIKITSIGS
jgi:BirA family transcriptional regulator, biotin operon repressor / biotin---[acetyl-CoA-carboxylase] ligase